MTDEGGYGRFGTLSRQELERCCYEDRGLIAVRRRSDTRLGFAVQLVTVRNLGMFLADPLDVPAELVEFLAEQLGIEDPSCVKRYIERDKTRLEHAWEIQREYGLVPFSEVQADLVAWIADEAWTTGDGPKAIFAGAVEWHRSRGALLPELDLPELMSRHPRFIESFTHVSGRSARVADLGDIDAELAQLGPTGYRTLRVRDTLS